MMIDKRPLRTVALNLKPFIRSLKIQGLKHIVVVVHVERRTLMCEPVQVGFQVPTQQSTRHQFFEPRRGEKLGEVDTVASGLSGLANVLQVLRVLVSFSELFDELYGEIEGQYFEGAAQLSFAFLFAEYFDEVDFQGLSWNFGDRTGEEARAAELQQAGEHSRGQAQLKLVNSTNNTDVDYNPRL